MLRLAIACYSMPSRLALDAHCSPKKGQFVTFRFGKTVDMLHINTSDKTIEIKGNHPITKPFGDMAFELKFLEKVMDKSGLAFSINAKEIIVDRLC